MPHLQALAQTHPDARPALFVTSGAIIHQRLAPVFSLSMAKVAQASLAKLLAEENKDFVHMALVTVGGQVTPSEEVNKSHEHRGEALRSVRAEEWDLGV